MEPNTEQLDTVLTRLEELKQRLAAHIEKYNTCRGCKYLSSTNRYCGLGLETFSGEPCSRRIEGGAAIVVEEILHQVYMDPRTGNTITYPVGTFRDLLTTSDRPFSYTFIASKPQVICD